MALSDCRDYGWDYARVIDAWSWTDEVVLRAQSNCPAASPHALQCCVKLMSC